MKLILGGQLRDHGVPWSATTINRLEKAGRFPKRVHLSRGTVAWVQQEIEAMVAEKIADREKPA